ncbi:uncharacterized protein LOC131016168 isoform X2 [Salvia miltiorrhiza]|uniref:uncharacterized protein LOC131016168 isoform X2 n=1 Tax=Salvia miltiorrhiza TaxID=226208 RepID=UPI0025ABAF36|nr:uncharacterized protein LOC131016168 isoform X2 [Salvia miltiorrhiza]
MADACDPLDFEFEEPIQFSPPPPKKKKKLIGLDDLLNDIQKEQKRLDEKKIKQKKGRKIFDADDDDEDAEEALLSECVDKCEQEINRINGDEQMPFWGIQVFGDQLPQQEHPELKSSAFMQSFTKQKINPLLELNIEKGEDFLEGLLADGWLLHLVRTSGCVEKSIATWTFNLMLYSSKMWLMQAACDFWSAILSIRDKADTSSFKIDWLPRYSDLKRALQTYGFLFDSSPKSSSDIEMDSSDSITAGPPQNIRCWIKFVGFCCQLRDADIIVPTQEAEDLLVIIISLFLDRQLVGLAVILHESLHLVVNSFKDEEWPNCCEKVAESLASRLPCNINCLRVVESIAGVSGRSKQLRSAVALQFLATILKKKVSNAMKILRSLTAVNVKDKNCDLFQMYICLSLAENWIFFDTASKDKAVIHELWGTCLRNCSSGITITDLRSYASNVRSKASYLLQSSANMV